MHEDYKLGPQREFEKARGWNDSYYALTYCTGEGVLYRKTEGARDFLDYEILDAERTSGAPDCVGKRQGKWGAYVYPKDPTARRALQRGLKQLFGWDVPLERLLFTGIVGPWLHKATVELKNTGLLTLSVLEDQAEKTPFEAKLFCVDVTGYDIGNDGDYIKATRDARWVVLEKLIEEQGQNPDYLYWQMIAMCATVKYDSSASSPDPLRYYAPGKHAFRVTNPSEASLSQEARFLLENRIDGRM